MPTVYERSTDSLFRRSFDTYVVAPHSQPGLVLLEGALGLVWELLTTPLTLDQVSSRLKRSSQLSGYSADAEELISRLVGLGLVAAVDEAPR